MINRDVIDYTKKKLIKINIAVVSGFLILFSLFIFFYFNSRVYSQVDSQIMKELKNIVFQLEDEHSFYPLVTKDPNSLVYVYKNENLIYYTQSKYFEELVPKYRGNLNSFFTYNENGYEFREYNYKLNDYNIQIIRNINVELTSIKQLLFVMCIAIIISSILAYFVGLFLTKKALNPIEVTWNKQAKFIQDASHELRTPITIISSKLESLLRHPEDTISDKVETIADAMNETRTLKKMISDLLILTKEEYVDKIQIETINIEEFINDICDDFFDLAMIQDKKLKIHFNTQIKEIKSDKNKLKQLLLIFIDNAFKYTDKGNYIKISLSQKKENLCISIEDNGIGIKKEDLSLIFDRFFRSDNVRDKDIHGSGIGLSIAKLLSETLKCKIYVESEYKKGTTFSIIIPEEFY